MLIYFTDGKGETELKVKPKGYKVLWVISGKGDSCFFEQTNKIDIIIIIS